MAATGMKMLKTFEVYNWPFCIAEFEAQINCCNISAPCSKYVIIYKMLTLALSNTKNPLFPSLQRSVTWPHPLYLERDHYNSNPETG